MTASAKVIINSETILSLMVLEGKPVRPIDVASKHNFPVSLSIPSKFIDALGKGFTKKVKMPKKEGIPKNAVYYQVTEKGKKYLAANKATVRTPQQVLELYATRTPRASKSTTPVIPMNQKAHTAVDSISRLLDDYNTANAMIRQIHDITGEYLAANKIEMKNEPSA